MIWRKDSEDAITEFQRRRPLNDYVMVVEAKCPCPQGSG